MVLVLLLLLLPLLVTTASTAKILLGLLELTRSTASATTPTLLLLLLLLLLLPLLLVLVLLLLVLPMLLLLLLLLLPLLLLVLRRWRKRTNYIGDQWLSRGLLHKVKYRQKQRFTCEDLRASSGNVAQSSKRLSNLDPKPNKGLGFRAKFSLELLPYPQAGTSIFCALARGVRPVDTLRVPAAGTLASSLEHSFVATLTGAWCLCKAGLLGGRVDNSGPSWLWLRTSGAYGPSETWLRKLKEKLGHTSCLQRCRLQV